MNKRNGLIDLYKFIGVFVIMEHHIVNLNLHRFFVGGWMMVEFFFFTTGYLTMMHFATDNSELNTSARSISDKSYNAIIYSFNKVKKLLPLVAISVIVLYIANYFWYMGLGGGFQGLLRSFDDLPAELLLLSTTYGQPLNVPLWFLSAMIIVFPLFCLILQIFDKYTFSIFATLITLVYYGRFGFGNFAEFPMCLPRAFFDLLVGAILFVVNTEFMPVIYKKSNKVLLTVIEIVCLLYPVVTCYKGFDWAPHIFILALCIGIMICMSGESYSATWNYKWMYFLGRLSMPIFVVHWVVGSFLRYYMDGKSNLLRQVIYYWVTIAISVVYILCTEKKIYRITKE